PTERQEHLQEHLEAHTRLDRASALRHVDFEDPIEPGAAHDRAATVLRGVAIAAAEAARNDSARAVRAAGPREQLGDVAGAAGLPNAGAARRGAPPAREALAVRGGVDRLHRVSPR